MRKKKIAIILLCLTFLTGCGYGQDTSAMIIKKNGEVKSYIVEDFSASYYDITELQESVEGDILSFNETYGESTIELKKFEVDEMNVLRATMIYEDANAYEEFNKETLFVGTLLEAIEAGYDLNTSYYGVSDASVTITYDELIKENNYHVVIFTEPVNVKVAKKVIYISEGLQKGGSSKEVVITDNTKEIYYIIYE